MERDATGKGWPSGKDNGATVNRLEHIFRLSAGLKEIVDASSSVLDFRAFNGEGACGREVDNAPEVGKVIHGLTNGLDDDRWVSDELISKA